MSTNDDGQPSFFRRYIDGSEKGPQQQQLEPEQKPDPELEPESELESEPERDPPEPKAEAKSESSGSVLELPKNKFIDPNVDAETLQLPLVRFPSLLQVVPEREMLCAGWTAFCKEIAPDPAPVIAQKKHVPYLIAGTLKEAELKN